MSPLACHYESQDRSLLCMACREQPDWAYTYTYRAAEAAFDSIMNKLTSNFKSRGSFRKSHLYQENHECTSL
jgi:hypothetical protein